MKRGEKASFGMEKNMYYNYNISDETVKLANQAEADLVKIFEKIDDNAMKVSGKILSAFHSFTERRVGREEIEKWPSTHMLLTSPARN